MHYRAAILREAGRAVTVLLMKMELTGDMHEERQHKSDANFGNK
jgi:hypothetical protein